jgi:hypothetical protein
VINHLVSEGLARTSPDPERPPEPEHDPLIAVDGVAFGGDGAMSFVAVFEDDPDASDDAFLMADQDDPVDLGRWR